jgi:hypothetical protein
VRSVLCCLAAIPFSLHGQITVQLSTATNRAFDNYIQTAEAGMDWKAHQSPKGKNVDVAPWQGKSPIDVESGLIHDWVASVLIPGPSPEKALGIFQDYPAYKKVFGPEVVDSRLLSHQGSRWHAWLRLKRKSVMTVELHTEYDIDYRPLGPDRWAVSSRSTAINELDTSGKELPAGTGMGFLWRLNAYWLIEPHPGGLYIECRSISLSRDIPAGLGWIVKPMVSTVPRDSLRNTVESVRNALR